MLAAHILAPRRLEMIECPLPPLEGVPGEPVLVRLHGGVLCASDFPRYVGGAFNVEFPRPVGDSLHECIGEIIDSRSPRFKPGDRVLAIPPDQRGMSEVFLADASMTVHLPSFEPRERLILAQPLATILWAARKLPNLLDLDVAIVGQGPIGLLFTHLVSNMGARRVIGLDRIDYRLDVSRQMRATHTVHVDREDPVAAVKELTDGHGADVVIEAVGHQIESIHLSFDLARKHGTVLLFGVPDAAHYPLPAFDMLIKNLRVLGSIHPNVQRDVPLAFDMIMQGRINVEPLITHRFPFRDAQQALDLAIDRRDNPIKVLLSTDAGGLL
ncbi:MAG: zinc-binding dehydrogenase [Pirellulales bacterium]|nr:zinc-binding dehydrogenase [Pirellulales bacterium]